MPPSPIKIKCQFCGSERTAGFIKRHENSCYMNPINLKLCVVCGTPLKNRKTKTCSCSCSNRHFRVGPSHGNWKPSYYTSTCFFYHEKKCVVCGEINIVAVHHLDGNRKNNKPENLIPLCPTHHQYWHSRFRYLVEDIIYQFVDEFKNRV